jgi:hypothetical protein
LGTQQVNQLMTPGSKQSSASILVTIWVLLAVQAIWPKLPKGQPIRNLSHRSSVDTEIQIPTDLGVSNF